jgi:hypothetical protein
VQADIDGVVLVPLLDELSHGVGMHRRIVKERENGERKR